MHQCQWRVKRFHGGVTSSCVILVKAVKLLYTSLRLSLHIVHSYVFIIKDSMQSTWYAFKLKWHTHYQFTNNGVFYGSRYFLQMDQVTLFRSKYQVFSVEWNLCHCLTKRLYRIVCTFIPHVDKLRRFFTYTRTSITFNSIAVSHVIWVWRSLSHIRHDSFCEKSDAPLY